MAGYPPGSSYPYGAPSAPPYSAAPQSYGNTQQQPYGNAPQQPYSGASAQPYGGAHSQSYGYGGPAPSAPYAKPGKPGKTHAGGGYEQSPAYGAGSPLVALVPSVFPPGTDPNVVACFQMADQDGSGLIDDKELQLALSSYNQSFSIRTVRLLMYLFTSSNARKIALWRSLHFRRYMGSVPKPALPRQRKTGAVGVRGHCGRSFYPHAPKKGPKEFVSLFYCLQSWRAIFERFDRDRSGKIDESELREALLSLGYAVSPSVLDLLLSKFDKTGGKSKAIEYDNFIECCLTVRSLTEKFKEKDTTFTGSATFTYESFMLTVLPFLII